MKKDVMGFILEDKVAIHHRRLNKKECAKLSLHAKKIPRPQISIDIKPNQSDISTAI